jgi:long-chain acyl-CoA synthetase
MEERWEKFFQEKHDIPYPAKTFYQVLKDTADRMPNEPAYEFYGKKTKYHELMDRIELTAKAFSSIGIRSGDTVTICMPNCPQAVDAFYALNRIGAISNIIHPLSAQDEITFYLNISQSKAILTLDQFYEKVHEARKNCDHTVTIIMARIGDELPQRLRIPYAFSNLGKYNYLPNQPYSVTWRDFLHYGKKYPLPLPNIEFVIDKPAIILYSGGTTGTTKGILLSDLNFNACAMQCGLDMDVPYKKGQKVLSIMPMFHGFGLCVTIHTCIIKGVELVLVPQFTVDSYAKLIVRERPAFIAGVPTLFEALLRTKGLEKADLSCLQGFYCGGDTLPVDLKHRVDQFVKERGAKCEIKEGYGTTECVNACCLTPTNGYREGSIGKPFHDTRMVICKPDTTHELPSGQEGEICISGPSVMLGYLNNPEETKLVLRKHRDGRIYLHTGDLGKIDQDGYVYFIMRLKRMIVVSGYNVYPNQIEAVIDSHPKVLESCCVGVRDPYKMHHVKAFISLKPNVVADDQLKDEIMDYLRQRVSRWCLPKEIEFRQDLPRTLVGKVAYRQLEEEEEQKLQAREKAEAEAKAALEAAKLAAQARAEEEARKRQQEKDDRKAKAQAEARQRKDKAEADAKARAEARARQKAARQKQLPQPEDDDAGSADQHSPSESDS